MFFYCQCFIPIHGKIIKNRNFLIKVRPISLINIGLVKRRVREMLGTIRNCGRWSEIVPVRLPDIESGKITFVTMLSISVLEGLIILVGCKI